MCIHKRPGQNHFLTKWHNHYSDVIMGVMGSRIIVVFVIYSTVCSGVDHWKHQSSASLASVRGIHRWPVNSPHKGPITRKMFPFDHIIMTSQVVAWWQMGKKSLNVPVTNLLKLIWVIRKIFVMQKNINVRLDKTELYCARHTELFWGLFSINGHHLTNVVIFLYIINAVYKIAP